MQNENKNPTASSRMQSIEETNAALVKEFAVEQESKTNETPIKSGESNVSENSLQKRLFVGNQVDASVSAARGLDQMVDPDASRKEMSSLQIPTNQTNASRDS